MPYAVREVATGWTILNEFNVAYSLPPGTWGCNLQQEHWILCALLVHALGADFPDDGLYLCPIMPVATTILSGNESNTFLEPFASIAHLEPNLVLIYDLTDF
jgi:hypothetical protein